MANKLFQTLLAPKVALTKGRTVLQCIASEGLHTNAIPTKEFKIPTQWGHMAAKLWGDENRRPILALHGWQDNAGTWDPLAPVLARGCSILALDFPGHGLSSWLPPGMCYHPWDLPSTILYIKDYFKWDKLTLLSHSMGSIASLRYASLFPEDVDVYIAIDSLIADDYDLSFAVAKYKIWIRKCQLEQTRLDKEPPSYSLEDIKKVWCMGTNNSVTMASVDNLLIRGSKPSKLNSNRYFFSRDSRLKYVLFNQEDKKFVENIVNGLLCPTLYIKAIDSPYASDNFAVEMRERIEKNNDQFELHFIPGTRHVHLNNPERVAPLVTNFLQKHGLYKE